MKTDKKVSVIVPNYNYEKYIEKRINSILDQTYPIYELILLDDASSDRSIEKMEQIIKKHPDMNIKTIWNKENSHSVFSQWQKGIEASSGDYFWIAEADDMAHPKFLETLMKSFEDEEVIISYSESARIDENDDLISPHTRDWMYGVSTKKWKNSYVNDGKDEIKNALSICNTIPNVSAVVFKKSNQVELLEKCKKFKISGDWYLYFNLLKNGKIAYHKESYNYFRKHLASTSTTASKETEIKEVLEIQKEIRESCSLTSYQIERQRMRYEELLAKESKEFQNQVKPLIAKRIAWIIPAPIKGSGGIRTMIQNANFLTTKGIECDIYIEEDYVNTSKTMEERIKKYYGSCLCNVYIGIEMRKKYDMIMATYSILTADYVYHMKDVACKAYFIQDFEPWFEPMGGTYLDMERTYKYGLQGISIGKWLNYKIHNEFSCPMTSFPFCADTSVYKPLKNIEKENAICFIYQPEKPRRCSNLGIQALRLVKELRPDVKVYLYGSEENSEIPLECENLGIIKIEQCNELYNKCKVGLCLSSSNPSRIPFEMMASGLPVVDMYRQNNLYDIPSTGVLLADSTPEALATALIQILDDEKLQKEMSKNGHEFMKEYPLERGFEDFYKEVCNVLNNQVMISDEVKQIYNKEMVTPSQEVMEVSDLVKAIPRPVVPTGPKMRFLVRLKQFILRKLHIRK